MKLIKGKVYLHRPSGEQSEFRYMGQTGLAIVCTPGDSGGGMQSCWAVDPKNLEESKMTKQQKKAVEALRNNLQFALDNLDKFSKDGYRKNFLMAIGISSHQGELMWYYGTDPVHKELMKIVEEDHFPKDKNEKTR